MRISASACGGIAHFAQVRLLAPHRVPAGTSSTSSQLSEQRSRARCAPEQRLPRFRTVSARLRRPYTRSTTRGHSPSSPRAQPPARSHRSSAVSLTAERPNQHRSVTPRLAEQGPTLSPCLRRSSTRRPRRTRRRPTRTLSAYISASAARSARARSVSSLKVSRRCFRSRCFIGERSVRRGRVPARHIRSVGRSGSAQLSAISLELLEEGTCQSLARYSLDTACGRDACADSLEPRCLASKHFRTQPPELADGRHQVCESSSTGF